MTLIVLSYDQEKGSVVTDGTGAGWTTPGTGKTMSQKPCLCTQF